METATPASLSPPAQPAAVEPAVPPVTPAPAVTPGVPGAPGAPARPGTPETPAPGPPIRLSLTTSATWRGVLLRYEVALLSVGAALALTIALGDMMKQNQFALFVVAVIISSYYGGLGPGLLTTVLSTLVINYYCMTPIYFLDLSSADLPRLGVFVVVALAINGLNETRKHLDARLKRSERQLQERQAALAHVARLAMMNELATGLAHELNQPLSAIMLYSQGCLAMMQGAAADASDSAGPGGAADAHQRAEMEHAMHAMAEQAGRASQIIAHYAAFVRRGKPMRAPVDLARVVESSLMLMEHEVRRSGVSVEMDLAAGLPQVWGDEVQIEQVMVNLLKNAFEAVAGQVGPPKFVRVRVQAQELGRVTLEVTDNGPGLSDDQLARVFEPFYTTKDRGLGLGLAITRSIIESHGGRLTLERAEQGGACARVSLPVGEAEAEAEADADVRGEGHEG